MGGNGKDGDIVLFPSTASDNHDTTQATIHLNADSGDIVLRNADCAEEFAVAGSVAVQPGTVMVLDDDGLLVPSICAYDKRAVGIVSGAGAYKPGILLDRQDGRGNRSPIAMVGKVYCRVTADEQPIEIGDLLTTSAVEGHAMKASDPVTAFGAVIGKALQPLRAGVGLIPVLVFRQ
jgi:hypothetical protein